jgi:hypothetical protein
VSQRPPSDPPEDDGGRGRVSTAAGEDEVRAERPSAVRLTSVSWPGRPRPHCGSARRRRGRGVLTTERAVGDTDACTGFLDCRDLLGGVRPPERAGERSSCEAEVVRLLRHLGSLVIKGFRGQRLVQVEELAVRAAHDDAGLDAVLEDLSIAALQTDAGAVGDRRQDANADAARPRRQRQHDSRQHHGRPELGGNAVVAEVELLRWPQPVGIQKSAHASNLRRQARSTDTA